jgi:transcriptional regulator with XRE-family HTH domain
MHDLPLGRKIYILREDRSLSQTKLEVEAGLSFGTLSRIENGSINPTKETLVKIAKVLELKDDEFVYLINHRKSNPDENEVQHIVESVRRDLNDEEVPAYLVDTRLRVWDWNEMILKIIGVDKVKAQEYKGFTCMRILFLSEFNLRKRIPVTYLPKIINQQVSTYKYLIRKYRNESTTSQEIRDLLKDEEFKNAWVTDESFDYLPLKNEFYLRFNNKLLKIDILLQQLTSDNRFFVIRYFPKDQITRNVFRKLANK